LCLGKIDRGVSCSIAGCVNNASHSLSVREVSNALSKLGFKLSSDSARRVYLCEEHYKAVKKVLRKERMYERWRFG